MKAILGAIAIAAVLAMPAGLNEWLRKSPRNTERTEALILEAKEKAIAVNERFEAAADSICSGGWIRVTGGIQCTLHTGRKTNQFARLQ